MMIRYDDIILYLYPHMAIEISTRTNLLKLQFSIWFTSSGECTRVDIGRGDRIHLNFLGKRLDTARLEDDLVNSSLSCLNFILKFKSSILRHYFLNFFSTRIIIILNPSQCVFIRGLKYKGPIKTTKWVHI